MKAKGREKNHNYFYNIFERWEETEIMFLCERHRAEAHRSHGSSHLSQSRNSALSPLATMRCWPSTALTLGLRTT